MAKTSAQNAKRRKKMENQEMMPILQCSREAVIEHNLVDLSAKLMNVTEAVQTLPRTMENLQQVKQARADLRKFFESLETQRKQVKQAVMAPYERAETLYKNLVSEPVKKADALCRAFVEDVESTAKKECEDTLREYFVELCAMKGIFWLPFERLGIKVDMAMANQKDPKKGKALVKSFVEDVDQNLRAIAAMEDSSEILTEYEKTLDLSRAVMTVNERKQAQTLAEENRKKWQQVQETKAQNMAVMAAEVPEIGTVRRAEPEVKEFRVVFAATASRPMLRALIEFANNHNIKIQEVTENG
jgi:hypothetical protein